MGLNVTYPSPTADDRSRFEGREAVQAIARLEEAGHGWRADNLYRALAEELTSPGELAILSARAEKTGGHQLSLQIGKLAFGRGIDVAALAFPIGVIPANANISGAGKALAYAIARQESAFNPRSHLACECTRSATNPAGHRQGCGRTAWSCLFPGAADDGYRL